MINHFYKVTNYATRKFKLFKNKDLSIYERIFLYKNKSIISNCKFEQYKLSSLNHS